MNDFLFSSPLNRPLNPFLENVIRGKADEKGVFSSKIGTEGNHQFNPLSLLSGDYLKFCQKNWNGACETRSSMKFQDQNSESLKLNHNSKSHQCKLELTR